MGALRPGDGHGAGGRPQRRERDAQGSTPSRRPLLRASASPTSSPTSTVVRGGAGIFWNTAGNGGNALRLHRHVPFGPIYSFNPGNQFVIAARERRLPDDPPLDLALADNPQGSVIGVDPDYQPGYATQFNLTVEHELFSSLLLKASYVGNLGRHLDTAYNLNQAVPGPGAVNNRRPFFDVRPTLGDVTWAVSDGTAAYHAFQFSAEKRLTHGLSGLLAYTWGHSIDTVGQSFRRRRRRPAAAGPAQPPGRSRQLALRHPAPTHRRLELPAALRRGAQVAERRRPGRLRAGRLADQRHQHSSRPVCPSRRRSTRRRSTPAPAAAPTASATARSTDPTVDRWFDTTAFTTPAPFTYGNSGRNILYGPGRDELRLLALQGVPRSTSASSCSSAPSASTASTPRSSICPTPPSAPAMPGPSPPSSARRARSSSARS